MGLVEEASSITGTFSTEQVNSEELYCFTFSFDEDSQKNLKLVPEK